MPSIEHYPLEVTDVLDSHMAYVDTGAGDPIVFLHGNPTSSYLWRNIIPYLSDKGRCLAPDLIGMGDSGKTPNGSYRFVDHARYLGAWLNSLNLLEPISFVLHDWGSALGFDWACRHPDRVKGIAYMEAVVRPMKWSEWPDPPRGLFQVLRTLAGEEIILQKNIFVERILPASIIRKLTDREFAIYCRPYLEPGESRRPTLTWPREIPLDGEPSDVTQIAEHYANWLSTNDVPKLFINADPGIILVGSQREFCRTWPNQREVTVKGLHFIQEDSPDEIGKAISEWYQSL